MKFSDFEMRIECDGKVSTVLFVFSSNAGEPPVIVGAKSEFAEFGCRVMKTEAKKVVTKRRMVEIVECHKRKKEVEEAEEEGDSTEYTYDD